MTEIQKSDKACELASQLLQSSSAHQQFFGALTYTIKLSTPSSVPNSQLVTEDLLHALRRLKSSASLVVLRKIFQALCLSSAKFSAQWHQCIPLVVSTIVPPFNHRSLRLALEFCITAAHYSPTIDLSTAQDNDTVIAAVVEVLEHALQEPDLTDLVAEAYGAWGLKYGHNGLEKVTNQVIKMLETSPTSDIAIKFLKELAEIINITPGFLNDDHQSKLASVLVNLGPSIFDSAGSDPQDEQLMAYISLAISLCQVALADPNKAAASETIATLIQYLVQATRSPSLSHVDNELELALLDFWNTYIETLFEISEDSDEVPDIDPILVQVVDILLIKSAVPSEEIVKQWDSEDLESFNQFKQEASEIICNSYTILGDSLILNLTNNIVKNLDNSATLEASLFCITLLSTYENTSIDSIFDSKLGSVLSERANERLQITGLNFLGANSQYFSTENGLKHLHEYLEIVFKATFINVYALPAACAFFQFCVNCKRDSMQAVLPTLMHCYISHDNADSIKANQIVSQGLCILINSLTSENEYMDQLHSHYLKQIQNLEAPELVSEALLWFAPLTTNTLSIIDQYSISQSPYNTDPQITRSCCQLLSGPLFNNSIRREFLQHKLSITQESASYNTLIAFAVQNSIPSLSLFWPFPSSEHGDPELTVSYLHLFCSEPGTTMQTPGTLDFVHSLLEGSDPRIISEACQFWSHVQFYLPAAAKTRLMTTVLQHLVTESAPVLTDQFLSLIYNFFARQPDPTVALLESGFSDSACISNIKPEKSREFLQYFRSSRNDVTFYGIRKIWYEIKGFAF